MVTAMMLLIRAFGGYSFGEVALSPDRAENGRPGPIPIAAPEQ